MSAFNKALGKKIKAKGLLKLRFHCQMCDKVSKLHI
jgi:hypothetical protein